MFGPQLVELLEGLESVTLLKGLCIRVSWLIFLKQGLYVALAILEFKSQQHYQLVLSALCLLIRCKL